MGLTIVDLYRSGNASSPGLDKLRTAQNSPNPDIDTYINVLLGDVWVKSGTGGASTVEQPDPFWRGKTWFLRRGSSFSDRLKVVNDAVGHWSWEPAVDMKLTEFRQLLADVQTQWVMI